MEQTVYEILPAAGGVRLVRIWGTHPVAQIPSTIHGKPVVAIGARCFASAEPIERGERTGDPANLALLAGRYVEEIHLPPTVHAVGNAAFADCRNLRTLSFGASLQDLGSDLFLNCRSLRELRLHAPIGARSGLRRILLQLQGVLTLQWVEDGAVFGRFLFPEYDEYIDENIPAHIFNLHIDGVGYPFRQAFQNEVFSPTEYDNAFAQATIGEQPPLLCRLALLRLWAPLGLSDEARAKYESYLNAHPEALWQEILPDKDTEPLLFLTKRPFLPPAVFAQGAALAASLNFGEGAALLLAAAKPQSAAQSYDFDEFIF